MKQLLKSAGLDRDAERVRSLQARMAAAYEAGRNAEGDRLAGQADVLVEKIDNALIALEEEGEPQEAPLVQSITREMAEAWQACIYDPWNTRCREAVEEYRRTGHGEWQEPQIVFVGPTSKWGKTSPEEHPEWYESRPGYYVDPTLVYRLREIIGDHEANGLLLLEAAEDAWHSGRSTIARIRAGTKRRRLSGVDPVKEAKKFVRRMTRRKKRTSRNPRRRHGSWRY